MPRICAALFVPLLVCACGAAQREVAVVGQPILYAGRVVAARGPTMARDGSRCTVEVQRADGAFLNCRIRIRCNDDLVYGLSGAGFNNCREEGDTFVFAHDTSGTRRDGDPRMFFDLDAGRVIISDDDPDVEVLVDLMTSPSRYPAAGASDTPETSAPETNRPETGGPETSAPETSDDSLTPPG